MFRFSKSLSRASIACCVAAVPLTIDERLCECRRPRQARRALHRDIGGNTARQGRLGDRHHRQRICRGGERHDDRARSRLHRRTGVGCGAREELCVGQFRAGELFGVDLATDKRTEEIHITLGGGKKEFGSITRRRSLRYRRRRFRSPTCTGAMDIIDPMTASARARARKDGIHLNPESCKRTYGHFRRPHPVRSGFCL